MASEQIYGPSPDEEDSREEVVFCGNCGDKLEIGDLYCLRCGARIADFAPTAPRKPGKWARAAVVIPVVLCACSMVSFVALWQFVVRQPTIWIPLPELPAVLPGQPTSESRLPAPSSTISTVTPIASETPVATSTPTVLPSPTATHTATPTRTATPTATPRPRPTSTKPPTLCFEGRHIGTANIDQPQMRIRGHVQNSGGEGIPGALVRISAYSWYADFRTWANGYYYFDGLANALTYTVSLPEYLCSNSVDVDLDFGKEARVDFVRTR